MKTFIFAQKNGSAIITLSATNEEEANTELSLIVKDSEDFRLEEVEDED